MKQHGPCIYFDNSTKSEKRKRHKTWRADITVNGVRYRRRSKNRDELEAWIKSLKGGSNG